MSADYTVFMTGDLANLEAIAARWHYKILTRYIQAADATLQQSQIDAPVDTGDLLSTGTIGNLVNSGVGEFSIEVIYGDGTAMTTVYDYPDSLMTTQYPSGDTEADGYAEIVELGHFTSTMFVPPADYLGSNFDIQVLGLEADLIGILDR